MKLSEWLKRSGLPPSLIADRLGVCPATLTSWVRGTRVPGFKSRIKIQRLTNNEVGKWSGWFA